MVIITGQLCWEHINNWTCEHLTLTHRMADYVQSGQYHRNGWKNGRHKLECTHVKCEIACSAGWKTIKTRNHQKRPIPSKQTYNFHVENWRKTWEVKSLLYSFRWIIFLKFPFLALIALYTGDHFDRLMITGHFHTFIAGWMEHSTCFVVIIPQLISFLQSQTTSITQHESRNMFIYLNQEFFSQDFSWQEKSYHPKNPFTVYYFYQWVFHFFSSYFYSIWLLQNI